MQKNDRGSFFVTYQSTSRAAYESVKPGLGPIDSRIVELVRYAGGATSDEIEEKTGLRHQTVSAQIRHLNERGVLVKSLLKRKTRSGRAAIVWMIA